MFPKLIAISGKLTGASFALDSDEIAIGREASNQICLHDPSVSRRHCLVKREAPNDQFKIIDLDSFNGTFVNGVPVQEQLLTDGDQVKVGDVLLLFLLAEREDENPLGAVQIDDTSITRSAVRLPLEEAIYLHPDKGSARIPATRAVQDLSVLLKISAVVNSIRTLDQLPQRLLDLIGEAVPAQRSAILLREPAQDELVPAGVWSRAAEIAVPLRISRTVTAQVVAEGVGLLSNDIVADERLDGAESLAA